MCSQALRARQAGKIEFGLLGLWVSSSVARSAPRARRRIVVLKRQGHSFDSGRLRGNGQEEHWFRHNIIPMRAAPGARWALAAVVGILAFGTVASAGNAEVSVLDGISPARLDRRPHRERLPTDPLSPPAQRDDPYYPGCVDRGYIRAREGALFELNNNVERLQASPAVLRRFQQGTRLALHMDERNLQSLNITNLDDMPTTDIIELFDLPVTSNIEEGWCTRILDIFMSLFFRRVVDLKFASKLWLDIDADLPVSAKMAERIFSSPSSVGWPEGDAAMDRFYKIRKSTLVRRPSRAAGSACPPPPTRRSTRKNRRQSSGSPRRA